MFYSESEVILKDLKAEDVLYLFESFRNEISYEANLIVQRSGWFITSQAFLFSCLVLGIPKSTGEFVLKESVYYPIIPILAATICILTHFSIRAAMRQASIARRKLDELCLTQGIEKEALLNNLHQVRKRSKLTIFFGALPSMAMPVIFLASWSHIILN